MRTVRTFLPDRIRYAIAPTGNPEIDYAARQHCNRIVRQIARKQFVPGLWVDVAGEWNPDGTFARFSNPIRCF
jgi:hypothetical protein